MIAIPAARARMVSEKEGEGGGGAREKGEASPMGTRGAALFSPSAFSPSPFLLLSP